jgi:hypothetical protein
MSEVFDRLAKMAAQGISRRDALRGLGALLTGGFLFGLIGRAKAQNLGFCEQCCAACKQGTAAYQHCLKHCLLCLKRNRQPCCGTTTCGMACCKGKAKCCSGASGVPPTCCAPTTSTGVPQACCNGVCVALNTTTNCGSCGNVCPPNPIGQTPCCNGTCCPPFTTSGVPQGCCNGACIPLNTSKNCGKCGHICLPIFSGGVVIPTGCCNGVCVPLNTIANCGSCGNACPPISSTGVPQGCCSGKCIPLNTNSNCGACGNACPPGSICTQNAAGVWSC